MKTKTKQSKRKKLPEVQTMKVWDLDDVLVYLFDNDKDKITEFEDEMCDSDISFNGDVQDAVVGFDTVGEIGERIDENFKERTEYKLLQRVAELRDISVRL